MKNTKAKRQITTLLFFTSAIVLSVATGASAWGADSGSNSKSAQDKAQSSDASNNSNDNSNESGPERVNTENIRQKYWARGNEAEIGVVQNRTYSKAHKVEASLLAGFDFTDPMLSVYVAGGRIGYHFNEYFSAHLLGYKAFANASSTQTNLLANLQTGQIGTVLNTNEPQYYIGGEAQFSLLYGKLSVLGAAIIHYDFHFVAGLGTMRTETGNDFEQHVGFGQQFFLSKDSFINVDYRLMLYHETIPNKVIPSEYGQPVGTRENLSNVITVGVGFLIGHGN